MSGAISELPEQEVLSGVLIPQELSPLFNLFEKPEMKKSLIALAVMAASGASMAQVTLYGVADVAVGAQNNASATAANPSLGLTNDKFQAIGNNQLNNGNSRFGLKGTEKIGGLTAGFNFEAGVNLADGSTKTNVFERQANVSLGGAFGEVVIGRQFTTAYDTLATWELTGTANYSAAASQFGYGSGFTSTGGHIIRDDATVKYNSPTMGGFKASVAFVLEGNGGSNANALNGGRFADAAGNAKGKYDIGLTYANDKLAAGLNFNKVTDVSENASLGAKYNFGMATVAASVQSLKTGVNNTTVKEGFTLGASAPIGAFTLTADVAQATKTYNAVGKDTGAKTNFLLEAKYALSKRTFVYGAFLRDGKTDEAGTKDIDGYSIGVRHNF